MMADGWKWWSGHNEEWMTNGPCGTREQAIEEAQNGALGEFQDKDGVWKVGIHIVEARNDPLRLADWIGVDDILERAEEELSDSDRLSELDEPPWFECTAEQEDDLVKRIKRACDEWQEKNKIVFTCNSFSATRNAEYVVVSHPEDE